MSFEARKTGTFPAIAAGTLLLLLAVLADPSLVRRLVPLQWHIGNIESFLRATQILLIVLAALLFLARRRVTARLRPVFSSPRSLLIFFGGRIVVIAAWIVVTEMFLRLTGLPFEEREAPPETAYGRYDSELGWAYLPDISIEREFGGDGRRIPIFFDSIGSRVVSPATGRDEAAPTVLFVGGSITMGHGVSFEESFSGVLDAADEFPFQVVNLGVQAYGTDQSLLQMKRHLETFNTNAVVYTYICDHVMRNAVPDRRLITPELRYAGTKPQFVLGEEGRPELDRRPARHSSARHSRLWETLRLLWTQYGPVPDMKLTRALVREMKAVAESAGAEFLVVNWEFLVRPGFCAPKPFEGMDLAVLNTVDHRPPEWDSWKIAGDWHPDGRAHRYVAGLILEEFRARKMLSQTFAGTVE
jgi:hypothetical protein